MFKKQLIECVPNFSEGRDLNIIKQITDSITSVSGVQLLDVDPGQATNRTVVTFVGEPEPVVEAAFLAMKKAKELIDMRKHKGEHPRFGAADVVPLVPVANITMEECVQWARKLAKRAGEELDYPIYCYEYAAFTEERRNLANCRSGEYEGLEKKLKDEKWKPDFGPAEFRPKTGASAVGARDFLIAVNFNLNTTSTRRANSVAFDLRENGRILRKGDELNGEIVYDEKTGKPKRTKGTCPGTKAIGWFIEEYGIAQVSMNITSIKKCPLHFAFEEACKSAQKRGMRVTGTEIVGVVPMECMIEAGKYFLKKQRRSCGVPNEELIKIAIKSMGLNDVSKFEPNKKIIELMIPQEKTPLLQMTTKKFAEVVASDAPAPGGGSISAYVGALGVALATMVANLSANKKTWDKRVEEFSEYAEKGQQLYDKLLYLVDADTKAFNKIMNAYALSPGEAKDKALNEATREAIEIPFSVMKTTTYALDLIKKMTEIGNPSSVTDAGVGALCARTAIRGAYLNVKINMAFYKEDKEWSEKIIKECEDMVAKADQYEKQILQIVDKKIAEN